jgi:glutaredoxin 3
MEGLSAEMGMAPVTVYTRRFCGYCTAAKKLFSDKGIAFQEIDATGDPDKRNEMIERSGRFTFPQIFIGRHHVGGYTDLYALHVSGELDGLLAAA